jgi:DNA-directed RNA polymerase subunit F
MRIRTDGKHERREETIEAAAEYWDCNKTKALLKSADVVPRLHQRIRSVLEREDLTPEQKREIAETLTIPNQYELAVEERVAVEV